MARAGGMAEHGTLGFGLAVGNAKENSLRPYAPRVEAIAAA